MSLREVPIRIFDISGFLSSPTFPRARPREATTYGRATLSSRLSNLSSRSSSATRAASASRSASRRRARRSFSGSASYSPCGSPNKNVDGDASAFGSFGFRRAGWDGSAARAVPVAHVRLRGARERWPSRHESASCSWCRGPRTREREPSGASFIALRCPCVSRDESESSARAESVDEDVSRKRPLEDAARFAVIDSRLAVVGIPSSDAESELERSSASDADPPENTRERRETASCVSVSSAILRNAPRGQAARGGRSPETSASVTPSRASPSPSPSPSERRDAPTFAPAFDPAFAPETPPKRGRDAAFAWSPARYTELASAAAAAGSDGSGSTTSARIRRAVAKTETVSGDERVPRGRAKACSRRRHPPHVSASAASKRGARAPQQGRTPKARTERGDALKTSGEPASSLSLSSSPSFLVPSRSTTASRWW